MLQHKPSPKKCIKAIGIILIALVAIYLLRGVVRGSLIPGYDQAVYKQGVVSAFNNDFTPINQQLVHFGFSFPKHVESCDYEGFHNLSETVTCRDNWLSNEINPSDSYVAKWRLGAPQLESYILATGWHKENNSDPRLASILVPPYGNITYSKTHGQIVCKLQIAENPPAPWAPTNYRAPLWAEESCERSLMLFGGSAG
jgi:hypothetical protein